MKVNWNEKYTTVSVYTIITFAVCLAMIGVIAKFAFIKAAFAKIFSVLSPVIWGFVIAYLLNPVMAGTERLLKKLLERKKPRPKLCRALSTVVAIIFGVAVICALIAIIVPQVLDSIMNIFNNAQTYMNNIIKWVNSSLAAYPEIVTYVNDQLEDIKAAILSAVNNLIPKVGDWAVKIKDGTVGLLMAVKDFLIGFIVAVYFLLDKEQFLAGCKKVVTAIFPRSFCKGVFNLADKTNKSITGFISGKILDSFIIGVLCFIIMTIMDLEYTVLISVIVGVTNIIPFFGPFIGAVPSALLLLLSAPKQTLPFIILIVALQQFDGNILGPHILGDSTGLPAFWVMFAIFIGGGLFGFGGMLLGVPLFAVVYTFAQELVEYLLRRKGLSHDTADYYPVPKPPEPQEVPKSFKLMKKKK
ncbi:MAG: AI-2E family transporter [Oscillospiraceae bacterium]|nr:AI-2E family transporter [Oscillospiraceae bacterium]